MREFSQVRNYRLWMSPLPQRIIMTLFLATVIAGLGLNIAMGVMKHGWTPGGVADYYRGNEERMVFEKTPLELVETAHMHLFVMPLLWLVLAHLFALTDWSDRAKGVVVMASFVGMIAELLAPWLVQAGAGWVWVKFAAGWLMGAGWLCLTLAPIQEMWWGHRMPKGRRGAS